ncbi:phage antirepressor KilAC domain-containing protein [Francisella sp. SYW-9]|uniref:phage antirepressor KilAC domain-containing protein n=1 Tax=Francisella sp. SYW-9 TaxID=2610888 RepID=UPI00123CD7B6|nr:phage antirepressor KilAC domain-containing protein [Francisella sp. SYW-9]
MNIAISRNQIGNEEINSVNARELHVFLEVKTAFKDWIKRMLEYDFEENADYISLAQKRAGNNATLIEYIITLDMAKEISMLQRTEKGKQARKYFIECEKQLKQNNPQALTRKQILQLALESEQKLEVANQTIKQQRSKVLFAESVQASSTDISVGELAKIIKQNGYDIGGIRLFQWLRDTGYLIRRHGTDFNTPTQRSMDLGLFRIKEATINHSDGRVTISKTVKVNGKGQVYFVNKFALMKERGLDRVH